MSQMSARFRLYECDDCAGRSSCELISGSHWKEISAEDILGHSLYVSQRHRGQNH